MPNLLAPLLVVQPQLDKFDLPTWPIDGIERYFHQVLSDGEQTMLKLRFNQLIFHASRGVVGKDLQFLGFIFIYLINFLPNTFFSL